MTKYPNSACDAHKNVTTSDPVCLVCMDMEIRRLRNQVEIGQAVVNFGVGLMTKEQVGQWVGVRHFLEAGTDMYPPFDPDCSGDPECCPNNEGCGCECADRARMAKNGETRIGS